MNSEVDIALKNISETKNLLETLIISSERFDYPRAKIALKELQKKIKTLTALQAELAKAKKNAQPNIEVLDFQNTSFAAHS